jgi:hypothetical protein
MRRRKWTSQEKFQFVNAYLLTRIKMLKAEHPRCGYRGVWAAVLGINQIFTSRSNPRGNEDIERVSRTRKEDLV